MTTQSFPLASILTIPRISEQSSQGAFATDHSWALLPLGAITLASAALVIPRTSKAIVPTLRDCLTNNPRIKHVAEVLANGKERQPPLRTLHAEDQPRHG